MSAKPQTALEFAFTLRCYVTQKAGGSYLFDAAAVTKLVAARDAARDAETRRMALAEFVEVVSRYSDPGVVAAFLEDIRRAAVQPAREEKQDGTTAA